MKEKEACDLFFWAREDDERRKQQRCACEQRKALNINLPGVCARISLWDSNLARIKVFLLLSLAVCWCSILKHGECQRRPWIIADKKRRVADDTSTRIFTTDLVLNSS